MSEKSLVVQHNRIIEARYKLTLEEQRLIKTLVSQIQPTDDDFKAYEIRILDLAKLLGITDDYYYNKIKVLTKKLRDSSLCFTDENGNEVQTGWLSSAIYKKGAGIVELRFDPVLKPYLLQLKSLFTSYELGNILRLKGVYSIRIYELLKQYEKIGKREFPLDDFKKMLGIDTQYQQYREFKKFVISPAKNEVCEKTDISFTFQEKTHGRKVTGLIFHISSKKRKDFESSDNLVSTENIKIIENNQLETLINIGVTRFIAEQLIAEFDSERINRAINYTKEKEKTGSLNDPAAFVVTAIQKDFTDSKAKEKEKQEKALQVERDKEKLKKRWEILKNQYEDWKKSAVDIALLEMEDDKINEHKKQFLDSLNGNSIMLKTIQKSKESENRHFSMYLKRILPIDTFEVWAEKQAIDLSIFPADIKGN